MKFLLFALAGFVFVDEARSQTYAEVDIQIKIGRKKKVTQVVVTGAYTDRDTTARRIIIERLSNTRFSGAKKGTYLIKAAFIIDKNGYTSSPMCMTDPGYGMCVAVIRVLEVLSGRWKPNKLVEVRVGT
jgi:hypothetical protein